MKPRFPLFARILVWLFLNLTVLALVGFVILRGSIRVEALFTGPLGDRVQKVADTIAAELRERPRTDWDGILARYQETYGVDFLVFRDDHQQLAGPNTVLPPEVMERLAIRRRPPLPPDGEPRHGPDSRGPGEPRGGPGFRGGPPPDDAPPPGGGREGVRRGPRGPAPPRYYVRSTTAPGHWMILPLAIDTGRMPPPPPVRLILHAPTLSAGGLFLDYTPWVWAMGGAVLFSVLWWLPFVGRITRSLGQMTAATEGIAEGRFDVSIDGRRTDELGRLGQAISRMAVRLEGFVTGQKRFLGDIAHELCTPLARMEMALGVLEQRADAAQLEYVNDVRDEVRQMSGLVNELLSFSKAGLRGREVPLVSVPLRDLVERVIGRDAGGVEVQVDMMPDLRVMAESELLARALGNLVRNATRYAGAAGPIMITARAAGGAVEVAVQDVGGGVPEEAIARLGEPFFRPDSARTREQGGTGLGLAIVRSCVEACRGTVQFHNREPRGFEAVIRLANGGRQGTEANR